jgi:hypothetical protein
MTIRKIDIRLFSFLEDSLSLYLNGQDAFTWKTGFQPVMAERVILLDGQDARLPSQARCLTSIQQREESRAPKDFAPRA